MNYNKVQLAGNLTRDPEVKVTASGVTVCKFGLAVNERFTRKNGEAQEKTVFVDVTAFGKTGEAIGKYLAKGSRIFVEGKLNLEEWEDKNGGGKRSKISVLCDNFCFIDRKSERDEPQERPARRQPAEPLPEVDEDVPF